MDAEIIAIGSELLLGETVDTNSAYLARQLAAAGVNLFRKGTIGDNQQRIAAMVSEALNRVDLVICTGGLGPTLDDVTREAIAEATGRELEFKQELLDQIAARFAAFGRTMSPSNRRQAFIPAGARVIENPRGTAPSFIVEDQRGTVIALPGVPSEMIFLFETAVLPYLRQDRGVTDVLVVKTLHAIGRGESVIGELLADLMQASNPTLGISAKQARYELRIGARADSQATAQIMIAQTEAIIRSRLGSDLVGETPVASAVVELLAEQDLSLAIYEGSARASIVQALQQVAIGEHLCGGILHPLDRPADIQAAASLAASGANMVLDRWRSQVALGVQTMDQPGPDGMTDVCVALVSANEQQQIHRRFDLRNNEGWGMLANMALDLLRRHLLASKRL